MGGVFGCCDRQVDISSHLNRMGVFLCLLEKFSADGIFRVSSVGVYMEGSLKTESRNIDTAPTFCDGAVFLLSGNDELPLQSV